MRRRWWVLVAITFNGFLSLGERKTEARGTLSRLFKKSMKKEMDENKKSISDSHDLVTRRLLRMSAGLIAGGLQVPRWQT